MLSSKVVPISAQAVSNALRVNLPPLRERAVPLSQSAVLRYLRKGDDLNLDGAGNAARLHLAVKHYGVVPGLGQKLHLGLKQAVQAGVGVLLPLIMLSSISSVPLLS